MAYCTLEQVSKLKLEPVTSGYKWALWQLWEGVEKMLKGALKQMEKKKDLYLGPPVCEPDAPPTRLSQVGKSKWGHKF